MTATSAVKASHSVRADRTASAVESFASTESPVGARRRYTTTGDAAVVGMARPSVGAVIDVIEVVTFITPPIGKVVPIVVPIAKMAKVSIEIVVEVAEEENRREAHVKR